MSVINATWMYTGCKWFSMTCLIYAYSIIYYPPHMVRAPVIPTFIPHDTIIETPLPALCCLNHNRHNIPQFTTQQTTTVI